MGTGAAPNCATGMAAWFDVAANPVSDSPKTERTAKVNVNNNQFTTDCEYICKSKQAFPS